MSTLTVNHIIDSTLVLLQDTTICGPQFVQNDTVNHLLDSASVMTCVFNGGPELSDMVKEFCIPFIVGIFAFALPHLYGVVNNIDQKFKSKEFIPLILKDRSVIFALIILILSLSCLALLIMIPYEGGRAIVSRVLFVTTCLLIYAVCLVFKYTASISSGEGIYRLLNHKYNNKKLSIEKYYKLLGYLIRYAQEQNIELYYKILKDIANNKTYKNLPQQNIQEVLYHDSYLQCVVDVIKCYKEQDVSVSDTLGDFYGSLFGEDSENKLVSDSTCHYLLETMMEAEQRGFYHLVNSFQSRLRFYYGRRIRQYADLNQRYANLTDEKKTEWALRKTELLRLNYFAVALNAYLFSTSARQSAIIAVKENTSMNPFSQGYCIPVGLSDVIDFAICAYSNGGEFKMYSYIMSRGGRMFGDITAMTRAMDTFNAYLILDYYGGTTDIYLQNGLLYSSSHDIVDVINRIEQAAYQLDKSLFTNEYSVAELKAIFANIRWSIYTQRFNKENRPTLSIATTYETDPCLTRQKLEERFRDYLDIRVDDAKRDIVGTLIKQEYDVTREEVRNMEAYQHVGHVDVYSRLMELYTDALSQILMSYQKLEEDVTWDELREKIANVPNKNDYVYFYAASSMPSFMEELNVKKGRLNIYKVLPYEAVIAIKAYEAPLVEIAEAPLLFEFADKDVAKQAKQNLTDYLNWEMPQAKMTVTSQIRIHYNKRAMLRIFHIKAN